MDLLERDAELDRISGVLAAARAGRGGLVVLEGPAGIGKTALAKEVHAAARAAGMRGLRARGGELEHEFAFGIVRQLFEPLLRREPSEDLYGGAAGVAGALLGLPGAPAAAQPPPVEASFAVLHGLYWLCANLAARGPLCLIVDDAHLADLPSLRFLAFLAPRLEELPVALVVSARSGADSLLDALAVDDATVTVRPAPLSQDAVRRLVREAAGSEPDEAFVRACRAATGGMPLLVRGLLGALDGIEPTAEAAGRVEELAGGAVGKRVLFQLGRLSPDAVALARAVAVFERAELRHAAALAELDGEAAARAADALVQTGILDPGRPLGFVHPLVRTGVYGELSSTGRTRAHRRAARLLAGEPGADERVAEHLLATDPAADAWAVERLTAAARVAVGRGAPEPAVAYLRRALAERQSPPASLLLELGVAEFSAGVEGWQEHLEGAARAAADDDTRVVSALVLGTALVFHERPRDAVEVVDRVAARLDGAPARLVLEAMAVAAGMIDAGPAAALAGRAQALRAAAEEPDAPRNVLGVAAYLAALDNEPAGQAAALARRAVAAGPRPLPDPGEPPWFLHAAVALFWAERYEEAQELLDAAVNEARATADGLLLPPVLAQRAWLELRRGRLTAAQADARLLLEAMPTPPAYRALAAGVLIEALVEGGELEEAERAGFAERAAGESQTAAVLRYGRGRVLLAQMRFTEALREFTAAGEIAARTRARSPAFLAWRSHAAICHVGLGETAPARALAGEELALARSFGAPRALSVALRGCSVVAGEEMRERVGAVPPGRVAVAAGDEGEALLREAVALASPPLERAQALADLGALLRRSKRRADARPLLREALDIAHQAGARPLAIHAETELRAAGAKPRQATLTGLGSLTASERRVAELAAGGFTNRQIAQSLFVTGRTVETHLTQVFRKLDVSSREQLDGVLR